MPDRTRNPKCIYYSPRHHTIPLWLKIVYTAFVIVLVPIYSLHHGPANFLWFSNIALLGTVVILWRESSLLASSILVLVLLPELGWNVGFFGRLITGVEMFGLTGYMFDPGIALHVRVLSLYHVVLPPLLLWLVYHLGYDPRGLKFATLIALVVLPIAYIFSSPEQNINWTYGFGEEAAPRIQGVVHLAALMAAFPLVFFWPTHLLLRKFFPKRDERTPASD
jgi:hypothetical protein